MASLDKSSKYASLDTLDDLDIEDDSDTTLASEGFRPRPYSHHKRPARIPRMTWLETTLIWFRWGSIVALQGVIFLAFFMRDMGGGRTAGWSVDRTETGGDVNGLYVPTSHEYTLLKPDELNFVPNMTGNENRMEVRRNWDMLMLLGSGSVAIPDYEQHPMLGKPIVDDPIRTGPLFEASWTHALHCLYDTVDTYHQLVLSSGQRFGFDGERDDDHAAHCFEYIRDQILYMADMTLEGSESVLDTTGGGQAHMCRNREEAVKWIEERRVDDIQSIVGP